jgi:outer membrane lipoprotein-sorting protein
MRWKFYIIPAICAVFCMTVLPFAQTGTAAPAIPSLIRQKYGAETTFRCEFDLTIFWKVREKTEHKSGTLYIAPGDRFRLELGKALWVSDGRTYWQYSAATAQVVIKKLLDVDLSMYPSQIISTYLTKYEFTLLEADDRQAVLSWQAPRDAKTETRAMTLWVESKNLTLKKLLVVDAGGNESTYTFKKSALGAEIPDATFTFSIPEGAAVLDNRE